MRFFVLCFSILVLFGCEKPVTKNSTENTLNEKNITTPESNNSQPTQVTPEKALETFVTIEWEELIPEADLNAILNPPDYILQVADGSMEDQLENSIQSAMSSKTKVDEVYEQALISTNIIEAMNGKNIRIPGFIVPVEFMGEKQVSSFFLVPYFGACLHMPPPPPNQVIYVRSEEGITLESLYDPVWISGKLSTEMFEDQVATSAYTMKIANIAPYELVE